MHKIIAKNKLAHYSYELKDKIEAGIELLGWEVKSIREGNSQIKGSFVIFKNKEAYLQGMHISLFMNSKGDEMRSRKLLLHKNQLKKLIIGVQQKGMSLIAVYLKLSNKGFIKIDIALAKGKTKIDKRETIKQRDISRKIKKDYNI